VTRRTFLLVALPGISVCSARAARVGAARTRVPSEARVGVFGLFHPRELTVRPAAGGDIILRAIGADRGPYLLRGDDEARVMGAGGSLQVACAGQVFRAREIQAVGRTGGAGDVELGVPGRITRRFRGRVGVAAAAATSITSTTSMRSMTSITADELAPVVTMDLETAVGSVVAAEQTGSAPLEALKALAVAARSYFSGFAGAGGGRSRYRRHSRQSGFEFCDTTHCQFLRGPAADGSPARRAAQETAGLVLAFRGEVLAALYSASCGGRTRSLADAGFAANEGPADGYPYFSVECSYCARRASGVREGHGVGLCEAGAAGLAADAVPYREILSYYYPDTTLTSAY
jgi:hypothetical protein